MHAEWQDDSVRIRDEIHVVGIYVVATKAGLRQQLERKGNELRERERSYDFHPQDRDTDFATLQALLE